MTTVNDADDKDIRAISVNFNETRDKVEVHYANGLQISYDLVPYHHAVADGTINVDTAEITFNGEILDVTKLSSDLNPDNSPKIIDSPDNTPIVQIEPAVISSLVRTSAWSQLVDMLPILLIIIGAVVLIALGH